MTSSDLNITRVGRLVVLSCLLVVLGQRERAWGQNPLPLGDQEANKSQQQRLPIKVRNQATGLPGWSRWQVARTGQLPLDVYVTGDITKRQPVMVLVSGSKCRPLFSFKGNGKLSSPLFLTDPQFFREAGVIGVALERRGIQSFKPVPAGLAKLDKRVRCRDEWGAISKDDRVEDTVDAIVAMRTERWFGRMLLAGHSEGVDVMTGAARRLGDDDIAALGLFAGAGPTQFIDFVAQARAEKDNAKVLKIFDSVLWLTSGKAKGKFGGYPLKRFESFAIDSTPLQDVAGSRIPLFVANGNLDEKASTTGADVFVLEVMRQQPKRPLYYWNHPELDHDLCDSQGKDHSATVFRKFVDWALHPMPPRAVQIGVDVVVGTE